jgi:hypothetical protein
LEVIFYIKSFYKLFQMDFGKRGFEVAGTRSLKSFWWKRFAFTRVFFPRLFKTCSFETLFEWWGRVSSKIFWKQAQMHASFENKIFWNLLLSKSKHFSFARFQVKDSKLILICKQRVAPFFLKLKRASFENDLKSFNLWKVKFLQSNFIFRKQKS